MSRQSHRLGITLLFVLVAFVALFGVATTSTTWAAPPGQCSGTSCPPPPGVTPNTGGGGGCKGDCGSTTVVTVTPIPSLSCTINAAGSICTLDPKSITVPAGAVPAGTMLTLTGPMSQPPCPVTSAGSLFLGDCFKVDWTLPNSTSMTPLTPFGKPVTDCLLYTNDQVTAAGGNAANLRIGFIYDPVTLAWTLITPTVDSANSRVCTNASQVFFYQALFTPAPGLPVTGGAETSPIWAWLVALAVVGTVSVWGGKRLFKQ